MDSMAMRTNVRETTLKTPHLEIAALRCGDPSGIPVLALHGWLDNAASFQPMVPYFNDMNFVALDWPGHGHSQHRHPSARYHFTEFMWDLHAVMDVLGWDSCHLVGHSMGAAVASLFATAAPDRVRSITLIDALGPYSNQPGDTAQQLRRSSASVRGKPRARKTYPSIDAMVQARLDNSDMTEGAARLIVERSVQPVTGGFEWSYDPGLFWSSPLYFCDEQIMDCFRHIEAPTMTWCATPFKSPRHEQQYRLRIDAIAKGRHELFHGSHHIHMETPELLAGKIHDFIVEYDETTHTLNPAQ